MNGLLFLGSFLSYLILMIVIVCVAAAGFALGRVLRRSKNAKSAGTQTVTEDSAGSK